MRADTVQPAGDRQARSRRIGRCAGCHAPVLAEDEHYGEGEGLVHSTCARAPTGEAPRPGLEPPAGDDGDSAGARRASGLAAAALFGRADRRRRALRTLSD